MPSVVDVKLVTVPVLVLLSDAGVLLTPQHGQIHRPVREPVTARL